MTWARSSISSKRHEDMPRRWRANCHETRQPTVSPRTTSLSWMSRAWSSSPRFYELWWASLCYWSVGHRSHHRLHTGHHVARRHPEVDDLSSGLDLPVPVGAVQENFVGNDALGHWALPLRCRRERYWSLSHRRLTQGRCR